MSTDRSSPACFVLDQEALYLRRESVRRRRIHDERAVVDPWSYLAKLGRGTIRLESVEYRILMFLAARPYHAFSRRRIARAVSTDQQPVTAENLGRYVRSLRRQLGFFANYIQTVPRIGYRFKA